MGLGLGLGYRARTRAWISERVRARGAGGRTAVLGDRGRCGEIWGGMGYGEIWGGMPVGAPPCLEVSRPMFSSASETRKMPGEGEG